MIFCPKNKASKTLLDMAPHIGLEPITCKLEVYYAILLRQCGNMVEPRRIELRSK